MYPEYFSASNESGVALKHRTFRTRHRNCKWYLQHSSSCPDLELHPNPNARFVLFNICCATASVCAFSVKMLALLTCSKHSSFQPWRRASGSSMKIVYNIWSCLTTLINICSKTSYLSGIYLAGSGWFWLVGPQCHFPYQMNRDESRWNEKLPGSEL